MISIIRVIDLETCGFAPDNAQIVEVATVNLYAAVDGWKRGRMWSSLVNPGRPIPPEASAVHHITDEMVADAANWHLGPAAEAFRPDLTALAAHNMRFEREVLRLSGTNAEAGPPWICTYKCALAAWPEAPSHAAQALRYWLKLTFADDPGPPHRALGDAYVTAAILQRLLRENTIRELIEVSGRPALLPRFTFGKYAMVPLKDVPTDYLHWIIDKMQDANEDVLHTARHHIAARRQAAQARSPV